jgi:hypothetical protein
VMGGHLWVYPLPYGYTAEVRIRLMGGLRINNKTSLRLTLTGGGAGLIFDARGRPLILASDVRERAAQFPLWVSEVTGDPVLEIDPRLLEAVQVVAPVMADQKRRRPERSRPARPARGGRRGRKQDAKAPAGTTDELEPDLLEFIEEEDLDDLRRGL